MEAGFTSLVIYDSRLFNPGSLVSRWAGRVKRRFEEHAIQEAPMRSGELKAGIHGESFRAGTKHWEVHIHSDAPHTLYVLEGTTGPIMSNRLWAMRTTKPHIPFGIPRGGRIMRPDGTMRGVDMRWLHSHGYAMRLRPGGGFPGGFALTVSGQDANNFMARAAARTAVTNRSLRGFTPGYGFQQGLSGF